MPKVFICQCVGALIGYGSGYPKEYWKINKGEKTSEIHSNISLDIFKEPFGTLALGNERGDVSDTNGELSNILPNEILKIDKI